MECMIRIFYLVVLIKAIKRIFDLPGHSEDEILQIDPIRL